MTVAAASTGASVPAQTYPLDAQLQAMVKQLPVAQQAAALAQLQQLTPAQQQQVIAQASQAAAAQQNGAGTAATAPATGASGTADRVVSVVYWALVRTEEAERTIDDPHVAWFPAEDLPPLAFDHDEIVGWAVKRLKLKPLALHAASS